MLADIENLMPDQLFALAQNPAAFCRAEAVARLRAIGSPLAKHFDPKPVQIRTTERYEAARTRPPANPAETIAMLGQFPVDRLMDIVSASSVYSREIRLEAARLVKQRSPMTRYARHQSGNVSDASKAPTVKQIEGLARNATNAYSNQFDRKVALRMENDPEFANVMREA